MGGQWHRTGRITHIFYGKGNENLELGPLSFVHKRFQQLKGLVSCEYVAIHTTERSLISYRWVCRPVRRFAR
jgi:hypothetical protein